MRRFWHSLSFCFFVLLLLSSSVFSNNLLKNGDFESGILGRIPQFWGTEYYNCSLAPGYQGKAIKIINKIPLMSLGAQEIKIDWQKTPKISFSAFVKIDNVIPGLEDWNKANIQLLFFDAKGKQVGGWPELGKWQGTFGWKKVAKNFFVPAGAVRAKVVFGLYNCTGEIYIDDIILAPLEDQKKSDPYNMLNNGDFEVWEKWAYGGSDNWEITNIDVKHGNGALRIKNNSPVWSFASQSVSLDGTKIKKIKLSGYIKAQDIIAGIRPWQLARINIEFKDGKGKRIGGWPIIEAFSGTFGWKYVEQIFEVPSNARRVDVFAGLLECSGEAWFDDLRFEAYDYSNKPVIVRGIYSTDTKNWYKFWPKYNPKKSVNDVSFLLDPPAGKHGFLKVKNGHFYFEDGTRVRFWGTNIYAPSTFPKKSDASKMAERLAKAGCNLVRIHHIDAFWSNPNIFDPNYNDTQHISFESLDKLDYFIYELKKRGIYVFMDLLVDREFKEGDNVSDWKNIERGAKVTGFFDLRVKELQKIYAKQLLTHVNPYTGLSYINDPVVVSAKLINEAMLFYLGTYFNLSSFYLKELDELFNDWLVSKYGNREKLADSWTDKYGRCDLQDNENPNNATVRRADIPLRYQRSSGEKREPYRVADTLRFYEEIQTKYFKEMEEYLKNLGLKVPVSGSNHWVNLYVDVKSNSILDYIDRHRYWDHPQFGYGTQVVFENQSMLKNPADALPNNFAFYRVDQKPFVISEWNSCFPNEFRVEGPLVMAAYANLQDWDGVLQFSFNNPDWMSPMQDNFDISAWPNVLSQWAAAALVFYRKDVSLAYGEIKYNVTNSELYGLLDEDKPISDNSFLPYITKTSICFDSSSAGEISDYLKYHNMEAKTLVSDTKELKLDYGKGIFTINTDKTQAVVGFVGGKVITLKDITIKPKTNFCSISLTSLNNLPISKSNKILLTAAARIENSGQKYNETKTQLEKVGSSPIVVEGTAASISFKRKPKSVKALDANGNLVKKISVSGKTLSINSSDKAFFYDVSF